jgi:hypothetical protein
MTVETTRMGGIKVSSADATRTLSASKGSGDDRYWLDATSPHDSVCISVPHEDLRAFAQGILDAFPEPPKPLLAEQLAALNIGDQYTITYITGRVTKGIKVSDTQVYSYTLSELYTFGDLRHPGAIVTKNGG